MAALAVQALERIPTLPEWVEPSVLSRQVWPAWHEALLRAHADPADASARERLGYDELFATQLALRLVRASNRQRPGLAFERQSDAQGKILSVSCVMCVCGSLIQQRHILTT